MLTRNERYLASRGLTVVKGVDVLPLPGDKKHCDTCSLVASCNKYKPGSRCRLSSKSLSVRDLFVVHKPETLLQSLGDVLRVQAERVEQLIEDESNEEDTGRREKLRKEVDKNLNTLFRNGMTLHRAMSRTGAGGREDDGEPRGGPRPGEIAQAIRAMEAEGVTREHITRAMVRTYLRDGLGAALGMLDEPMHQDEDTRVKAEDIF